MQQAIFTLLLIIVFTLLSVLNNRNQSLIDISNNQHNSITEKSQLLLSQFKNNLHFTAYTNKQPLIRQRIQQWFNRYQRVKPDISLEWINPETAPTLSRNLGITVNGTLIISYGQQQRKLTTINESSISNALYQILNHQQKTLVFLSGHGERNPHGIANHDWLEFTKKLSETGIKSETRVLLTQPTLNPQSEILVLASPLTNLFEQEQSIIKQFIARGGNSLIVIDPNKKQPLKSLLQQLHVAILPGTIVDVNTVNLGIKQVDFAIVSRYTAHPLTRNFKSITLYPQASALDILVDFDIHKMDWDIYPFLSTLANSWTETSKIEGNIHFNANSDERAGPLDIGLLLTRKTTNTQQRVVVMGDGDFVANAYLANGGNLALGIKIIQWLSSNDELLHIENTTPSDLDFSLSDSYRGIVGLGFLIVLPLLLLIIGLVIHKRRRNR